MVSRLPDHVDRWHPMRAAFWARLHLHNSYGLFRELLILARMGDHIGARIATVRTDSAAYRPRSSTGARRLARFSRSGSPSAHESSSGGGAACVIANQNSRFAWFLNMVLLGDDRRLALQRAPRVWISSYTSAFVVQNLRRRRQLPGRIYDVKQHRSQRNAPLLVLALRTNPHAPPLEHDRINCNQLTTNSLPTGKCTREFQGPLPLARAVPAPSSRRTRPAALQLGATA